MAPRFSLHKRNGKYYAQLHSAALSKYLTARCTGAVSRSDALLVVAEWMRDGWPTGRRRRPRPVDDAIATGTLLSQLRSMPLAPEDAGRVLDVLRDRSLVVGGAVKGGPGDELLSDFLTRFWDYDCSPYVREKLAHGQSIGRRRCYDATKAVRKHWLPALEDRLLAEVTPPDLRELGLSLRERGLSAKTINNVMEFGCVALRWAHAQGVIPGDPTASVRRFSGRAATRGVVTPEEAAAVFRVAWEDERARVGNLVAATCGLRGGEVVALQVRDVGTDRLVVRHSWSEADGLKTTKTGEERFVPLLPAVRESLLAIAADSPHSPGAEQFIFYDVRSERPMRVDTLVEGLKRALAKTGVAEPERKRRRIDVHAWRHYYAARMADVLGERTMKLTGHRTAAVFEIYSNHRTERQLREASVAAEKVFHDVVPDVPHHVKTAS